jgi:hypothetical protein
MKRKRVQIRQVAEEVHQALLDNPGRVLKFLQEIDLAPDPGTTFLMACVKTTAPRLEVRYYPGQEDYFLDYTSCILKDRDDYEFHSFRLDEGEWELFLSPPVVGLGVRTRLRPGSAF